MVKKDYIDFFNTLIRGEPVSLQKIIPMISEYLTEIKLENKDKICKLILQNPQIANNYLPDCIRYYCKKYCILSIIFKNQTILYYE
jgi:hypothetical protein